jgi:hypothetical protein
MATVNNASGVWNTLGYNFSDPNNDIKTLSQNTLNHMNVIPAMITTWQAQDIANNTVGGYYVNPVANLTINISTTANSIIYYTKNVISMNTSSNTLLQNLANTPLYPTSLNFLDHTNRISGVTDYNTDMQNGANTYNKPYLQTALSAGKAAQYVVYQTDNIQNTAPTLGSFTSLFIGPQISNQSNVIVSYPGLIANSITIVTSTDANGNTITSNVSNLSYSQLLQISNDVTNTNSLLYTQQTNDETYYTNLQTFSKNYNTVTQFNNMGETQSYLVNNFIGSPKLLSRINS